MTFCLREPNCQLSGVFAKMIVRFAIKALLIRLLFAVVLLILMPLLVVFAFLDRSSGLASFHTVHGVAAVTQPLPTLKCKWPNMLVTKLIFSLCFFPGDHLSSQPRPPPLPPAPPPHRQHPSITSLSRSSLANQRSPSPPPTAGLAADLQSTAECVQLQDSWVLGSNVALESRWVIRGVDLYILYTNMWCQKAIIQIMVCPQWSDVQHRFDADAEIWAESWKCWSFRM